LHINDSCISNCHFCYKVNEIRNEAIKNGKLENRVNYTLQYLREHPEVDNILFSGGDPASFRAEDLSNTIQRLISPEQIRVVRFATKGIVYAPNRFLDDNLLSFFRMINQVPNKQVSVVAQINHPAEFSRECKEAIKELQNARVQIRGQPAIVKGVNDSVDTLVDLQRQFLDNRIISYYFRLDVLFEYPSSISISTLNKGPNIVINPEKFTRRLRIKGFIYR